MEEGEGVDFKVMSSSFRLLPTYPFYIHFIFRRLDFLYSDPFLSGFHRLRNGGPCDFSHAISFLKVDAREKKNEKIIIVHKSSEQRFVIYIAPYIRLTLENENGYLTCDDPLGPRS